MIGAVGVDVGGTAIKAVLTDSSGALSRELTRPTPRPDPNAELTVTAITECVHTLSSGARTPVGIACPGLVDSTRGVVVNSVNLGWKEVPIRALVEQRLGIPVGFGHDVRAAGLAEIRSLPAIDSGTVTAFVAVGTGLAAAIFVGDQELVPSGWAGEIGQIVFPAGPHRGKRIEEVASASGLADRMGTRDAAEVARLVTAGDPRAAELWDDAAAALAFALATLVAAVAPDAIILGGGLSESGGLLVQPTRSWLRQLLPSFPLPAIRPATQGRLAGALGAACLGRQRLENDQP